MRFKVDRLGEILGNIREEEQEHEHVRYILQHTNVYPNTCTSRSM